MFGADRPADLPEVVPDRRFAIATAATPDACRLTTAIACSLAAFDGQAAFRDLVASYLAAPAM
jgi:hypothetical protein